MELFYFAFCNWAIGIYIRLGIEQFRTCQACLKIHPGPGEICLRHSVQNVPFCCWRPNSPGDDDEMLLGWSPLVGVYAGLASPYFGVL
jgi:hypothetical protein